MKVEIDYGNMDNAEYRAIEDIKEYLGPVRYEKAEGMLCEVADADDFRVICSFMGIEGYPVGVWFDMFQGSGAFESQIDADNNKGVL